MKIIYQCDRQGWFVCADKADVDPRDPSRYLIPAYAVEDAPPPGPWPEGHHPRWISGKWVMQPLPVQEEPSPVEKLAAFLAANPDVAAMINNNPGGV